MIVFDLKCGAGHVFEAWFGSTAEWEDQRARKLISCPLCGDDVVDKAVMAPAVGAKNNQKPEKRQSSGQPVPMSSGDDPARIKAMLSALAKAQAELIRNADYVGNRFADEARAMHLGEQQPRQIYGETTADEARSLIDDGVPVAALPLPIRPRQSDS